MSNQVLVDRLVAILVEPYLRRGIPLSPLSPADDSHCKRLSLQWLTSIGLAGATSNSVPPTPTVGLSQDLVSTIQSLDRQMDIYDDSNLLVRALNFGRHKLWLV